MMESVLELPFIGGLMMIQKFHRVSASPWTGVAKLGPSVPPNCQRKGLIVVRV